MTESRTAVRCIFGAYPDVEKTATFCQPHNRYFPPPVLGADFQAVVLYGVPRGSRTPVAAVRVRRRASSLITSHPFVSRLSFHTSWLGV